MKIQLQYAENQYAKQPNFEVLTVAERFKLYNDRLLDICQQQQDTISALYRRCAGISTATDVSTEGLVKRLRTYVSNLKSEAFDAYKMLYNAKNRKFWTYNMYESDFINSYCSAVDDLVDGQPLPGADGGLTQLSLARCRTTTYPRQRASLSDEQAKIKFVLDVKRK